MTWYPRGGHVRGRGRGRGASSGPQPSRFSDLLFELSLNLNLEGFGTAGETLGGISTLPSEVIVAVEQFGRGKPVQCGGPTSAKHRAMRPFEERKWCCEVVVLATFPGCLDKKLIG